MALAQLSFLLSPLLILAATSLTTDENFTRASLQAWADVLGGLTVLATALLAVPLALVHLTAGRGLKRLNLLAAVLLLTSVVERRFAGIALISQ
ncbi:hypothetical protein J8J14_23095 [Roseomonas sp. SSH11]|uniref:Uncharacterized protein n=1 Tax=Pararoseomonas baculiformis TaxID=2820812 RepID=A0ABS4AL95_9PROT|nr:hypothetical protein [Pararoseomonas baculiformis]MBP0447649.1 hypothetical protein [Pararoseomonas baculiformis]